MIISIMFGFSILLFCGSLFLAWEVRCRMRETRLYLDKIPLRRAEARAYVRLMNAAKNRSLTLLNEAIYERKLAQYHKGINQNNFNKNHGN